MTIKNIIDLLAATSSTNKKVQILKEHKDNELLKNIFRLCYNKRIVYGIKKIPERQQYRGIIFLEMALEELENRFATRQITGNAAIDRLQELMGSMSEEKAEILRRVVLRDMECGVSAGLLDKVWKDLIPSQPCMLASKQTDKTLAHIKFPAIVQLKADGTRCMVIKEDGKVTAWSRNGKEFTGIEPILKAVGDCQYDNFVLDGELIYKSSLGKKPELLRDDLSWLFEDPDGVPELSKSKKFNEQDVADRQTGNGIVSKAQKGTMTKEEAECVVLQCWDYIPTEDYWNGSYINRYEDRLELLGDIVDSINDDHVELIETHLVRDMDAAVKIYEEYIDQDLEGIILKNRGGFWEDKRSKDMVKFKQVIDIDMIIVGSYPHEKDPTKLGGLTIRSKCGMIECNVGSGFKDKAEDKHPMDRTLLMNMTDQLMDCVLECECNGVVKRKNRKEGEAPYKLFLPIAIKVRHDKDANQANTFEEIFG